MLLGFERKDTRNKNKWLSISILEFIIDMNNEELTLDVTATANCSPDEDTSQCFLSVPILPNLTLSKITLKRENNLSIEYSSVTSSSESREGRYRGPRMLGEVKNLERGEKMKVQAVYSGRGEYEKGGVYFRIPEELYKTSMKTESYTTIYITGIIADSRGIRKITYKPKSESKVAWEYEHCWKTKLPKEFSVTYTPKRHPKISFHGEQCTPSNTIALRGSLDLHTPDILVHREYFIRMDAVLHRLSPGGGVLSLWGDEIRLLECLLENIYRGRRERDIVYFNIQVLGELSRKWVWEDTVELEDLTIRQGLQKLREGGPHGINPDTQVQHTVHRERGREGFLVHDIIFRKEGTSSPDKFSYSDEYNSHEVPYNMSYKRMGEFITKTLEGVGVRCLSLTSGDSSVETVVDMNMINMNTMSKMNTTKTTKTEFSTIMRVDAGNLDNIQLKAEWEGGEEIFQLGSMERLREGRELHQSIINERLYDQKDLPLALCNEYMVGEELSLILITLKRTGGGPHHPYIPLYIEGAPPTTQSIQNIYLENPVPHQPHEPLPIDQDCTFYQEQVLLGAPMQDLEEVKIAPKSTQIMHMSAKGKARGARKSAGGKNMNMLFDEESEGEEGVSHIQGIGAHTSNRSNRSNRSRSRERDKLNIHK